MRFPKPSNARAPLGRNAQLLGKTFAVVCLLTALQIPAAQAKVLRVRLDGSGDYSNIQSGINAMAPGDQCLVGPGIYPEQLIFPTGKSGTPAAWTAIQAEIPGSAKILGVDTANCDYLRVQGFEISTPSTTRIAIGIAIHSSHVEITSNYVHDLASIAIGGSGTNVIVRGNQISRCASGIDFSGDQWLVEGNAIGRIQNVNSGNPFNLRFSGGNHLIRSNHFFGTIVSEVGAAQITGFQTTDANGQSSGHIVIENNLIEGFFHEGVSLNAATYSNSFDLVIRNNLFIAPTVCGISVVGNLRDVKIHNNTIVNPGTFGIRFIQNSGGEIQNNVIFSRNSAVSDHDLPQLMHSADTISTVIAARNLLYVQDRTLSQTSFPSDLVNQDPRFVSLIIGNYRLRPGSPGINAGATLTGFDYDFNGISRPQGSAWDIGAYEFSNASGAKPSPPGNLRMKQ